MRAVTLTTEDINRCPKRSLLTQHYRDDGTCRCDERDNLKAEVAALEQQKRDITTRLADARERLRTS